MNIRLVVLSAHDRSDRLLHAVLLPEHPTLSRAKLRNAMKENLVFWKGRPLAPSTELPEGIQDVELRGSLEWLTPPLASASASARSLTIPVVYEDEDLLVLHKPAGMPSVPHATDELDTAVGAALARFPDFRKSGGAALEPGLIHRLDTGTSGLLVCAQHSKEFERLKAVWKNRDVRKIYRALIQPPPNPQSMKLPADAGDPPLHWNLPIGHDLKSSKKMKVLPSNSEWELSRIRGKALAASTHLLRIRASSAIALDAEIEIETGVMHQIRVHCAHAGMPLLGDTLYGGRASSRLWLHAWRLELPLKSGPTLELVAALPEGWSGP